MPAADLEAELIEEVALTCRDPLAFAQRMYPWGEKGLATSQGPRKWQADVLSIIRDHLESPQWKRPCKVAVASGKGIGKSALVSMIINWSMSTCDDCKVVVTANTGTQLATKTVPEVTKWTNLSFNSHWWETKATSISSKQEKHDKTWRTDFIPWSKENMEAFSGLHNKDKRMVIIFDEASGIHDTIWDNTQGTLTDDNTEMLWIAFGNPTRTSGRFRECFGSNSSDWHTLQIDARNVEGTGHEELDRVVQTKGEDSYYVRIWIRGEFPLVGESQFISPADVQAARDNTAEGFEGLQKIMACDVARQGADKSVIGYRQGRKAVILEKMWGKDTAFVGERLIHWMGIEKPAAVVIDGDGLGAGTVDHLKYRGFTDGIFEFHGGTSANEAHKYVNRRTEVWGKMRDWMPYADIPDDPQLATDLTAPMYDYSPKGQICLERKESIKERGYDSPDCGDMLAMTFHVELAAPPKPPESPRYGHSPTGWMGV